MRIGVIKYNLPQKIEWKFKMKKSILKSLSDYGYAIQLEEMRLKLGRLQKEANDLEERIEGVMTEQDRAVFEVEERSHLRN